MFLLVGLSNEKKRAVVKYKILLFLKKIFNASQKKPFNCKYFDMHTQGKSLFLQSLKKSLFKKNYSKVLLKIQSNKKLIFNFNMFSR